MDEHPVWAILAIVASAVLVAAFYLDWFAWSRHKSDQAPARLPTWNPKYWRTPKRSWFRDESGYRLNRIARLLYGLAGLLGAGTFIMLGWVL